MRFARCCYDHLAGQTGVAITQGMLNRRLIIQGENAQYWLTEAGFRGFEEQGIELAERRGGGKTEAIRGCLDWTERQYPISGSLGAQMMHMFIERKWITRRPDSRALRVTPLGWEAFERYFGIGCQKGKLTQDFSHPDNLAKRQPAYGGLDLS